MEFKFVILCLACAFAMASTIKLAKSTQDEDVDAILSALEAEQSSSWDNVENVNALPYAAPRKNFEASVGFHKPASTFSIATGGLLAGQTEILRLLEAFLTLKGQVASHLFVLFNDNYEVIRGVANFLVSKVPHLHAFALKGIQVLRKILDFAVHTFAEWTIALPSVNFEASHNSYVQPHETYGVPAVSVGSFLENLGKK